MPGDEYPTRGTRPATRLRRRCRGSLSLSTQRAAHAARSSQHRRAIRPRRRRTRADGGGDDGDSGGDARTRRRRRRRHRERASHGRTLAAKFESPSRNVLSRKPSAPQAHVLVSRPFISLSCAEIAIAASFFPRRAPKRAHLCVAGC